MLNVIECNRSDVYLNLLFSMSQSNSGRHVIYMLKGHYLQIFVFLFLFVLSFWRGEFLDHYSLIACSSGL